MTNCLPHQVLPRYPSSLLRYGSKFVGVQQSDKQVYHVEVEIKHVDMVEYSICGYLRIDGEHIWSPSHHTTNASLLSRC